MNEALAERIGRSIDRPVAPEVRAFAATLAEAAGARAVLFYGSNLRTRALDGVLDFYVLLPGRAERGIWPRVSYHERAAEGVTLRAKVATMTLATFAAAARGRLVDTTVWARFAQPSALAWSRDADSTRAVAEALAAAAVTAARLAAALDPAPGSAMRFWTTLFAATYRAELRVEAPGRAGAIYRAAPGWFDDVLPLAWEAAGIGVSRAGDQLAPALSARERGVLLAWWHRRRRAGKPLNLVRLARAAFTFEGAARYAAWKIERHGGLRLAVTPWRERHPLLAAPGVLWALWRHRRAAPRDGGAQG